MRIYRAQNYEDMSHAAVQILSEQIVRNPKAVLGLATGSTPLGIYRNLVDWYQSGKLDFSGITCINLDEYKGLAPAHPQSYRYFMEEYLFKHINILPENTHVPSGTAADGEAECRRYEELIASKGGIDVQLLGVGPNGHIGFNEPGTFFPRETHCATLTQSTIQANKRFFEREEDVPRYAYTMGINSIMQARKILLVASGAGKAEILRKAFCGPVTPQVPASVLQLHADMTLLGDREALSLM